MKRVEFLQYTVYVEDFGPAREVFTSRSKAEAKEQLAWLLEDGQRGFIEVEVKAERR